MFFSLVDWLCAGSALEEWRGKENQIDADQVRNGLIFLSN